jgi:hypothetical protein
MTLDDFKASLARDRPPDQLAPAVVALWHDARGDWDAAHSIAQEIDDATGAWVHAYLHRREGDAGNAFYWYRRAGKPVSAVSLDEERDSLLAALLG